MHSQSTGAERPARAHQRALASAARPAVGERAAAAAEHVARAEEQQATRRVSLEWPNCRRTRSSARAGPAVGESARFPAGRSAPMETIRRRRAQRASSSALSSIRSATLAAPPARTLETSSRQVLAAPTQRQSR